MKAFDRFESRTWIRATLVMDTALAVGARPSFEPVGTDAPVIRDGVGAPFIPGSSIKGVVRSEIERWLRALPTGAGIRACDPLARPCVDPDTKSGLLDQAGRDDHRFAELLWEASCTVCRIFGSPWLASRILFRDAPLRNGDALPTVTQIRDGVGIDRDLGAAAHRIKYDFEVVVPGAEFEIEILAENLEDWELGLLLAALRAWEAGDVAIGGKRSRGPGWGRLRGIEVRRVERTEFVAYALRGTRPTVPAPVLEEWLGKLESLVHAGGGDA